MTTITWFEILVLPLLSWISSYPGTQCLQCGLLGLTLRHLCILLCTTRCLCSRSSHLYTSPAIQHLQHTNLMADLFYFSMQPLFATFKAFDIVMCTLKTVPEFLVMVQHTPQVAHSLRESGQIFRMLPALCVLIQ